MSSQPPAEMSKRSKSGCWTCRGKKVKCDEHKPTCHRCQRLNLLCDYLPRKKTSNTRFIDESILVMRRVHKASNTTSKLNSAANYGVLVLPMKTTNSVPKQITQEVQTSANSLELTAADHEAMRYFRTVFSRISHSKTPEYSVYGIIVNIAERDPMVMRAILALGGQSVEHRRQVGTGLTPAASSVTAQNPLQHYSAALRMMADNLDQREADARAQYDLDATLAALFLMLLYEKAFGSSYRLGLSNHLSGVAHVVKYRLEGKSGPPPLPRRSPLAQSAAAKSGSVALVRRFDDKQQEEQPLSLFSASILVHLAVQDTFASTFGFGGRLMTTLNNLADTPDTTWPFAYGALNMQYYASALYRRMWGSDYPQKEILEDLETRDIYSMGTTTVQIRFALSTLTSLPPAEAEEKMAAAQDAINQLFIRYGEIFATATELSSETDSSHRLVATIRGVVPVYYGMQIELCRIKRLLGYSDDDSLLIGAAVENIVRLARQTYQHQGSDALHFSSWALYLAAMETSDDDDRQWILDRFKQLRELGKNFERAYEYMTSCFSTEGDEANTTAPYPGHGKQHGGEPFVL